ncbi:MAG: ATP-binding cassette domain-containing protein [Verrucomicrobia bacterium]|nr:ATP-binding cassette domain-containing protein [Verrucomicrobiota bacterium]
MSIFLELENLKTHFPIYRGTVFRRQIGSVKAVDGINLQVRKGEILGLVGESGCGKSTLARTIVQLIPTTQGAVILEGRNLSEISKAAVRAERVNFQMIFQDPYASLNPRMTVYDTLAEAIQTRQQIDKKLLLEKVGRLMRTVGLPSNQMRRYPHEFSGGQRQRIAIARALAPEPRLIIADEPVSALDVSIQSQILNLIAKLCREMQLTMIFISHDISVVKYISDRIAVMYLGRLVELGPATEVVEKPLHPYTKALVSAIPIPDPQVERRRQRIILQGDPPSPMSPPAGCAFHPRCPYAIAACKAQRPELEQKESNRFAACIRVGEI